MKKVKLNKKHKRENSNRWIQRHINDEFVIKSKLEGYRSRSSYKLLEIDKKYKVFYKSKNILDLGCAPGGWLQVAKALSPDDSMIVGVDRLEIEKIKGVKFIKKDIFDSDMVDKISSNFDDKVDVVLSDMSPNSSGNKSVDHLRIISLVERVIEISKNILKPNGFLISKILQGGAQGELIRLMKCDLNNIKYIKPQASRKESSETYLIAKKN